MSDDRRHLPACDWNLYPEDRLTDPGLCNVECLRRPEDVSESWRRIDDPVTR